MTTDHNSSPSRGVYIAQAYDIDDLIDDLPPTSRERILQELDVAQGGTTRAQLRHQEEAKQQQRTAEQFRAKKRKAALLYIASLPVGLIGTAIGIALCLPVITMPLGLLVMFISVIPLVRTIQWHFELKPKYVTKDT